MKRKLRITVIEPDGEGGLAHFAYDLCMAIADEGNVVQLETSTAYELLDLPHRFSVDPSMKLWRQNEGRRAVERDVSSRMIWRKCQRAVRGFVLTREWWRVVRRVLRDKPDVTVFSEMRFPHLAFAPALMRRSGIVTAQICHEFTERDTKSSIVRALSRVASKMLFAQFDRIFFLSEATREGFHRVQNVSREKTLIVPHGSQSIFSASDYRGSDARRDLGISADEPVLLYFGYIRPSKGYEELLRAFAESNSRQMTRLIIAGRPTKFAGLEELNELVDRLKLNDRVVIRGEYLPTNEVAGYVEMCQAVVLPYRTASQSGVLHLAYGLSRPVVATSVGGLKDDVVDGETGLLVPPGDISALATAIDKIMGDADLATRMGCRAKELSDTRFTWNMTARLIVEAVRPLVATGPAIGHSRIA